MRNQDNRLMTSILDEVAAEFIPGIVEGIMRRLDAKGIDFIVKTATATPVAPLAVTKSTPSVKAQARPHSKPKAKTVGKHK